MNLTIGVTGYKGRLGSYLLKNYPSRFIPLDCDVKDMDRTKDCLWKSESDLVLHLAAKSDVDFCESHAEEAIRVNVNGTFNVCLAAEEMGIDVIMISSASVFSGKKWFGGYKESDTPLPVNFYGHTKMAAESLVSMFDNLKIIRTSYLFDRERMEGIRKSFSDGTLTSAPTFMKRSFMYLPHFAHSINQYLKMEKEMPSILNIAGNESVSWYEFISRYLWGRGYDTSFLCPRKKNDDQFVPRGKNLGLDVSLSAKLGIDQVGYKAGLEEIP